MVKIISDSTCDLSPELLARYEIDILPLHILLGDQEFEDGKNITPDQIYAWSDANKTTPKTSAPAMADAIELFRPYVTAGREIVCFSISSSMSTSGNVMRLAAEELGASGQITVIDSANLSTGIGLLVVEAAIMAKKNRTASEIVSEIEKLKPNVVKTYSKSSDLANMFSSGEIVAAIASDFAFETIQKAKPEVINVIPESGTYLNFNTININANSKNKDLAYEFINYVLSDEVQERAAKALNDAPINTDVKLNEEDAKNLAYGDIVKNAKTIDYKVVNPLMNDWINKWNRVMN